MVYPFFNPTPPLTAQSALKGQHFELIQRNLPPWITTIAPHRLKALQATGYRASSHYPHANTEQHQALRHAIGQQWRTQTAVDKKLDALRDVYAFAEPLLKQALNAYGEVDVKHVFLRTYTSASYITAGQQSTTSSLLDRALHNFAADETFTDFAFLSAADARGQQDVLTLRHRTTGQALNLDQFKAICRQLDIGAQYQAQLHKVLGGGYPQVQRTLREAVIASQQAAFTSAVHLAHISGDISQGAMLALLQLIDARGPVAFEDGELHAYTLSIMNCTLTGVVLFSSNAQDASRIKPLIAYVPGDPEHPLKQYPSSAAFVQELTRQLRGTPSERPAGQRYPQFFAQFIAHAQRGAFFSGLNRQLSEITWHQRERGERLPSWTTTAVENPTLYFSVQDIRDDYQNRPNGTPDNLWHYLYRTRLNKIINDAQDIAVSTQRVDQLARQAWWDNLEGILGTALNVALLVVTPFVPVMGELMLAYTAYQLTEEVFEGVLDWTEGLGREAAEHLLAVVESLLQLGEFAGAGEIVKVAQLKLSLFVEGMRPVQTSDGRTRLWHPDLAPYAQPDLAPPTGSRPQASGLHRHQGKDVLAVDNRHYEVARAPHAGEHRIRHPRRANAYQPRVRLNGHGACVLEGEQPRTWNTPTLLRRLGPRTQPFSDRQLEQMRVISGTDAGVLRGMYLRNEPLPPLLDDTLKRFEAEHYARTASELTRTGQPLPADPAADWFEQSVTELPGWPADKALEVFINSDLSGASHKYGNTQAGPGDTLQLGLAEVMAGKLAERVLGFLDEGQIETLLGGKIPAPQQVQALRNALADYVTGQTDDIARHVYRAGQVSDDAQVNLLRQSFPTLDNSSAERLLSTATPTERQTMAQGNYLPLRLAEQARELSFAADSALAFRGLQNAARINADSENLALNALRIHSDLLANLRVQVRETSPSGMLRCEVGPQDAALTRVLVRHSTQGYEVFDAQGNKLQGLKNLYESIIATLPAEGRTDMGFGPGQGAQLKQWLMEKLEPLAERRTAIARPPVRSNTDPQTQALLGGPAYSRLRALYTPQTEAEQTLHNLFPTLSGEQVKALIAKMEPDKVAQYLEKFALENYRVPRELEQWRRSPSAWAKGSVEDVVERERRDSLAQRLLQGWENRLLFFIEVPIRQTYGSELNLAHVPLPDSLPVLTDELVHVRSVLLNNSGFSARHAPFLELFPSLQILGLANNELTELPEVFTTLTHLEYLDLHNNRIVDASPLNSLKELTEIDLSSNPLTVAPDVSAMAHLRQLNLNRTQLTQWPKGLFVLPRVSDFTLQAVGVPLRQLPMAPPVPEAAEIIARIRLNRTTLDFDQQQAYEQYRNAVGLDPHRTYEPKGDYRYWLTDLAPYRHSEFSEQWLAVEREHGSQGFFEVIKALETYDDYQDPQDWDRYEENRQRVAEQVAMMLAQAHADSALRARLFQMASFPGLCADGAAQIFNNMGIETLATLNERYAHGDRQHQLVTLAKGAARLKLLGKVVRQDIALRTRPREEGGQGLWHRSQMRDTAEGPRPGEVDEVEIHLAYETSLAKRLDLPWVTDHMHYRDSAQVSADMTENAYQMVLTLSEGDGLVDQMLLEPYWETYLRNRYNAQYQSNEQAVALKLEKLDELQELLDTVAQAKEAGTPMDDAQQTTLQALAQELGIPIAEVAPGTRMNSTRYAQLLTDLGETRKQWARDLTRQALQTAEARGYANQA